MKQNQIIIENERGKILLVKDSYKGIYTFPGGQVEVGENLIDALKREIREETGVEVEVNRLICVSSNTGTYPGHSGYEMVPTKIMFGFICKYIYGELCASNETSESLWVSKDEVLNYISAAYLIERFKAYLNFHGDVQYLEYTTKPEFNLKLKKLI